MDFSKSTTKSSGMSILWQIVQLISMFHFILLTFLYGITSGCQNIECCLQYAQLHPICDSLRKNVMTLNGALFLCDGFIRETNELMRIINIQCHMGVSCLNYTNIMKYKKIHHSSALILDRALCEKSPLNSTIRDMIWAFHGRVFMLEIVDSRRFETNYMGQFEVHWNPYECFAISIYDWLGASNSNEDLLVVSTRKFEPFTIADNGNDIQRGIDIMLIELITQRMSIELQYSDGNSTLQR